MSRNICVVLFFSTLFFAVTACPGWVGHAAENSSRPGSAQAEYLALPLGSAAGSGGRTLERWGVPFVDRVLPLVQGGSAEVSVGGRAERIFLLGMTDAVKAADDADEPPYSLHAGSGARSLPGYGWADPRDESYRFFVGDELGRIRVEYVDGTSQVFPLRLGEGVWWGRAFYDFQEPFPTDAQLQQAFAGALRLYPAKPLEDGDYVAVIDPKQVAIRSITIENSQAKKGTLVIKGVTVESRDAGGITGAVALTPGVFPEEFRRFMQTKALRPLGADEAQTQQGLTRLKNALYSSDEQFSGLRVAASVPAGYEGPEVSFKGAVYAEILSNVFRYNLADIAAKIDASGMYHTSTKGAISWGGYRGFGTFRKDVGGYYGVSYTRDMGRSLGELAQLGDLMTAERRADYDLRMARRYATDPALQYKGVQLPPHWGMLVNEQRFPSFENDGQGLTILFLYKLWQRLPDRDAWLRDRWPDVKAAGDWILWQFAHPEISGAKEGLLHTTGESANGDGYSVYPDAICMHALRDLAEMAESIGDSGSAERWRERADLMQAAITAHYVVSDPKYGRVWTLAYANWTHKGTVLGPLIFEADDEGFAPQDGDAQWRAVDEATYQRLIDAYSPFGFYGQSMGYGQGFVTQSALLLDRMHDATTMLDWAAKEIYDPRLGSFIVPEGVQIDPTGRYWFRIGDLGNGVQEAEIMKMLRLVIGVDDARPDRLQFFPRMPYDWGEIAVSKYPVVFAAGGKLETASLEYRLRRTREGMELRMAADKDLGPVAVRLGPFADRPTAASVHVNGATPDGASAEQSGDSWWLRFTVRVGTAAGPKKQKKGISEGTSPHDKRPDDTVASETRPMVGSCCIREGPAEFPPALSR